MQLQLLLTTTFLLVFLLAAPISGSSPPHTTTAPELAQQNEKRGPPPPPIPRTTIVVPAPYPTNFVRNLDKLVYHLVRVKKYGGRKCSPLPYYTHTCPRGTYCKRRPVMHGTHCVKSKTAKDRELEHKEEVPPLDKDGKVIEESKGRYKKKTGFQM